MSISTAIILLLTLNGHRVSGQERRRQRQQTQKRMEGNEDVDVDEVRLRNGWGA